MSYEAEHTVKTYEAFKIFPVILQSSLYHNLNKSRVSEFKGWNVLFCSSTFEIQYLKSRKLDSKLQTQSLFRAALDWYKLVRDCRPINLSLFKRDFDRSFRQDKECVEMRHRVAERELNELREKLLNANRSISSATGNISNQEALIGQLRGDPFGEYYFSTCHLLLLFSLFFFRFFLFFFSLQKI